jgi:hypothetical protein
MSEEFKLQKEPKKTLDLDLDDIDFDEIKNEKFDNSSVGSLNFTKEKSQPTQMDRKNSQIDLADIFGGSRKDNKASVNIKKDSGRPSVRPSSPPRKPIIEPNSVDLGLDQLVNQQKKNVRDEPSVESLGSMDSRSSRGSRRSRGHRSDGGDMEDRVRNIMDERSESSQGSGGSRRSGSGSGGSELSDMVRDKIRRRDELTENQRKEELLFLFTKLEKKGFRLNQKFTMRSPLEDMERVYERLENERNLKASISFQRKVLMGIVSTLEFLNNSMNPFDIDLEGWSESIMENQNEYDDIFEELYEKYKDKGKVSPEVKLLMTLAGSAFYFHLSKTIVKSGQQKMNEMFGGAAPDLGKGGLGGMMGGLMKNFMSGGGDDEAPRSSGMRGPQGFDDVISEQSDKSDDIPSIHSSVVSGPKKKRTLNF